jgi:threonine aldolase
MKIIDLRSDTITQPTDEMIEAIVNAHKAGRFGDDVIGEDEVVNELQEKAAKILGKEAALLITSGTQGNLISLLTQTKRGDEIVVEERSHTFMFEAGAMASMGGLYPKPVKGERGYILPETLKSVISPDDAHYARTGMVVIENTHNYAGGAVIRPEQVITLASMAHDHGLKVHCDGARLFNAAVALNIPAKKLVEDADSVQICLSKGLSAPVGSIIAGTEIAAPGIVALEKMVDRLKEDHENAKLLYMKLVEIPNLVIQEPDTNILFLELQNLAISQMKLSEELAKEKIKVYGGYGTRTRIVMNRMVDREDIARVAETLERLLK